MLPHRLIIFGEWMKALVRFLFVFIFPLSLYGAATPHLMLYFDVNKTLIASDKALNKSTEATLNELLAEKYVALWDESLSAPLSFYAYANAQLARSTTDAEREQWRCSLLHFNSYLRDRGHPLYHEVQREYESAQVQLSRGRIFPSFYHLIQHLDRAAIPYSIILRSMGHEISDVSAEISLACGIGFSTGKFLKGALHLGESIILRDAQAIYTHLRHGQHAALNDDWHHWSTNGMGAQWGKPFYIDLDDAQTLSLFFDDNIGEGVSWNIVAPRHAKTGELLPIAPLLKSRQLVHVNTLEAILNQNYFLELVQEAIHHKLTFEEKTLAAD